MRLLFLFSPFMPPNSNILIVVLPADLKFHLCLRYLVNAATLSAILLRVSLA